MTDKLNDNDRQRIEQEARTTSGWNNWVAFKRGAEYATIYERQQHKEEIKKLKYFQELDKARHKINAGIIDELEAERSELVKENDRLKHYLKVAEESNELRAARIKFLEDR